MIRRAAPLFAALCFSAPLLAETSAPKSDIVPLGSLDHWFVECHHGSRPDESPFHCRGPASGDLMQGEDGALLLRWDLGWSDWVQILHHSPRPVDLSRTAGFTVALRGAHELGTANSIRVMFADVNNVFYGHELLGPHRGLGHFHRWSARLFFARKDMDFYFGGPGAKKTGIDWTRINRVYLAMVRPCGKTSDDGEGCFGGGKGEISLDSFQAAAAPPPEGNVLELWREDVPGPEAADASGRTRWKPFLDGGSLDGWTAECDGGFWVDGDVECAGLSSAALASDTARKSLSLGWNLGNGEWAQAKRTFYPPEDLSGPDAFSVVFEGNDTLGDWNMLGFMFAGWQGVFYGYEMDVRYFDVSGLARWRIHLSLPKSALYYRFTIGGESREMDWAHVDRFFVGVKRLPEGPIGAKGRLDFCRIDARFPREKPVRKPPVAAKSPAGDWVYTLYFPRESGAVPSGHGPDLEKVAERLKLYGGYDVLVAGFADQREARAGDLAAERCRAVAETLTGAYGIAASRVRTQAAPPGVPFPGERLHKAVIRFVESTR